MNKLSNTNSSLQDLLKQATHVEADISTENSVNVPDTAPQDVKDSINAYKQELQNSLNSINQTSVWQVIESAINSLIDAVVTLQSQVSTLESEVNVLKSQKITS